MPVEFVVADLKSEVALLAEMLGDTRVRFRHRETQVASWQKLIDGPPRIAHERFYWSRDSNKLGVGLGV